MLVWRRIAFLGVLLAGALAAPSAAAEPTFDAGALRVEVTSAPFGLSFVDGTDGDRLSTLRGGAPAPDDPRARYGPLGFSLDLRRPVVSNVYVGYYVAAEAETLWFHATKLLAARTEQERLILDVATNDPLGHRLEVTVERAGEGAVTLSSRAVGPLADQVTLSGAAFAAEGDERFLGFGERSNDVDQTGNRVFSWAEEGPFSSGEGEAVVRPLLPDFTFPSGPTATNFPIPWAVSTRGFGVLIDRTERSYFNLRSDRADAWNAEIEATGLRLTIFAGPDPHDVLRRYSEYAGRQPRPAPWLFGPWFQPTGETQPRELARRFRAEDVPVSVAQTYTHYLPCGAHRGREQAEREQVADYHRLGYRITTYFNPHVCLDYQPVYDEAARNGWFIKDPTGRPYLLSNPFTADEQVSEIDFTDPGAVRFFGRLLDEAIAAGYDGWMEDFGEYTPADSHGSNGEDGRSLHNRYPVLYHGASTSHTGTRAPGVFIRSGYHGVQRHARAVWGGDPTEDWSCSDGLCAALHQSLSMGLSGIAYWGTDIGGFHAIVNPRTDDELNIRWLQLGAVSGVMRTQANGYSFRDNRAERSQVWSPAVLPIWRRYAKLRTQLYPYLAAASETYQETGMPLARHLALAFPEDATAVRRKDELMFGPDLLAAPVIEPGARERRLYLPPGRWIDLWRSASYDEQTGALRLAAPAVLAGGRETTVPAPLEELPLLVRAGTVLPLLAPDVDTLAGVGDAEGVVGLAQRRTSMSLLAFPRGRTSDKLPGGERLESREGKRRWTLKLVTARRRSYNLQAALGTLRRPFTPCTVTVGDRVLPATAWSYSPTTRVLRARFKLGAAGVVVSGCR